MKMGESHGVSITMNMAKRMVKKYGKKDFLNSDDCVKVNKRRQSKSLSKSPNKDRR